MVVAASELTMLLSCCVFKALILLPSYKTKLGLAVGSYLQFISLSAALVIKPGSQGNLGAMGWL